MVHILRHEIELTKNQYTFVLIGNLLDFVEGSSLSRRQTSSELRAHLHRQLARSLDHLIDHVTCVMIACNTVFSLSGDNREFLVGDNDDQIFIILLSITWLPLQFRNMYIHE